jgi:hypothetical protein
VPVGFHNLVVALDLHFTAGRWWSCCLFVLVDQSAQDPPALDSRRRTSWTPQAASHPCCCLTAHSGLGTRQTSSHRRERLFGVRRGSVRLVPVRELTGRSDDASAQIDLIGAPWLMIGEEPSAAPEGGSWRGVTRGRVAHRDRGRRTRLDAGAESASQSRFSKCGSVLLHPRDLKRQFIDCASSRGLRLVLRTFGGKLPDVPKKTTHPLDTSADDGHFRFEAVRVQ